MTQTFDIRFARSAGLAALLEAPENRFRWKGGGLLRIDAQSISFTLKRGLLALFAGNRTRRIPAEKLKAVYREGDALRVEFQTDETSRMVLPFWAGDRDIAAQIVRLLPTRETVEIEHSTGATLSGKPRADWRTLLVLAAVLSMIGTGYWAVYQRDRSPATVSPAQESVRAAPDTLAPSTAQDAGISPVESPRPALSSSMRGAQRVEAPAFPLDRPFNTVAPSPAKVESRDVSAKSTPSPESPAAPLSEPFAGATADSEIPPAWRIPVTADGVVPVVVGMPGYEAARRQLDIFLAESNVLRRYYQDARYSGNSQRLTEIANLWWKVTVRVTNSPDFEDPSLKHLQEIELAVSRAWRRAFSMHSDPALLAIADAEVEFAEMLQERASKLVN